MKLQDLLQSEQGLTATSTLLGMKAVTLDCSGVESLTPEQMTALFSGIPQEWDFAQLGEIIDADTLTASFAQQLSDWVNQRQGRSPTPPADSPSSPTLIASSSSLDIFNLRDEVIGDYRRYIESFLKIRDARVQEFVKQELDRGQLWRDPLVQINPPYRRSATISTLIDDGTLHPDCQRYFTNFHFYQHQEQAFRCARRNQPYVLTTGTGSGKSLCYVVPIIDDLLRNTTIKGVRAILVYPMNALINSQEAEFHKFLKKVPNCPIRVRKYTGQESLQEKTEIQNNPPQILLTNYVMLELMLSRVHEQKFVTSPDLKFLVLDELHTYRGRQGADVAIVIRKLRQRCGQPLLCVGTSATMSTEGSREDRQRTVAGVASKLFGVSVQPENVIAETLERQFSRPFPNSSELRRTLEAGLPTLEEQTLNAFTQHPLSAWIEMNFGLEEQDGHLVRRTPISLSKGAKNLATFTELDELLCLETLQQMFLWSSRVKGLPFRLHQFISQGGSVYTTLEPKNERFLTLEGQYKTTKERLLYPLVFCRECGQEYYMVRYNSQENEVTPLLPTAVDSDQDEADIQDGYLILDEPNLWDESDQNRLPDNWFRETRRSGRVPKKEYQAFIPQKLYARATGTLSQGAFAQGQPETPLPCWFVPRPFLTCLHCGIVYDRKPKEYSKLARLSSEGRSTATTLLCLSAVSRLKSSSAIDPKASKILSFTDNRQDASLQAGHFNDFVQTSFLRASLNNALRLKGRLTHTELAATVFEQMGLSQSDYAEAPAAYGTGPKRNQEAFERLIEYRLYEDLRRGWRIVQPNLEQCGLLAIEYDELETLCRDPRPWRDHSNPVLLQASPEQRFAAISTLLDRLRRELVLDAELLQEERVKELKRQVNQTLNQRWRFDPDEFLYSARWASLSSSSSGSKATVKLTARSQLGRYLRSDRAWDCLTEPLSESEYELLIRSLIEILSQGGYLKQDKDKVQLRLDALVWKAQQVNQIPIDPITSKRLQGNTQTQQDVNQFFQSFYNRDAQSIRTTEGREHTGQVTNVNRLEREQKFREGQLSALFCSPTMELGIDISDLSVVHLRNVPPTPANYAQRSGRAGRGGQEALVITYASSGSGHDQYFFKRQEQMVAGAVAPPKLELANADLLKSHLYSLWLAYTGISLGDSMNQILNLEADGYPLHDDLKAQLDNPVALKKCLSDAQTILNDAFSQQDLRRVSWYSEAWLQHTLESALTAFDRACDHWRRLYRDAVTQLEEARRIIDRCAKGGVTQQEREQADDLQRDAVRQRDLLVGQGSRGRSGSEFEFYPYRYFASEGFLPGFNFPRLPVRAYIPAGENGEFIARPRVVAIRELAPANIVYYEGNKFQLAKTRFPAKGINYQRVKLCHACGYFHEGSDVHRDTCSHCGSQLTSDQYGNPAILERALRMETAIARRRERITCDEEERLKYGYNVTTHFRYDQLKQEKAVVKAQDGTLLLNLNYGETAQVWRINRGLRRSPDRGFKLDAASGRWGDSSEESAEGLVQTGVNLMVSDTCNILVVEPASLPAQEAEAFLVTLQYALERAITAYYKLEPDELASERLGDGRYLLFWEAAEGGAGILSQILETPLAFQQLAQTALDICHFREPKPSCTQACYECLLSYQNQFDHRCLNRHLIHSFLTQLSDSVLERHSSIESYDEQYRRLLQQTDPHSEFERVVLKAIYDQGIKLPDSAQEFVSQANCKPDFLYRQARIALFCDGSAHDSPHQQELDRVQREDLVSTAGYEVISLRYDEEWQAQLEWLKALL